MNTTMTSTVRVRSALLAVAALAMAALVPAWAQNEGPNGLSSAPAAHDFADRSAETEEVLNAAYEIIVQQLIGLRASDVVTLDLDRTPGRPLSVTVPIDGAARTLEFASHSTRSQGYELLVQRPDGAIVRETPGPVRTLRGNVAGVAGSVAAGSMLEDGLHAVIDLGGGNRFWIEPISHLIPGADRHYVIYRGNDVVAGGGSCGVPDAVLGDEIRHAKIGGGLAGDGDGAVAAGGTCIAELACDADTEYFNDYGTVANTEARINSVINTVNLQYQAQVGITHQITTIIVRTGSDPYTSLDAQTRLCEFITEWTNNQTSVQRDVAHLFTGAELSGGTIGIASDIGGTGICVNSGGCSGGTYGTFGSYCLSQSDFNNNFNCATDLTAHELGHLWGAFHCSCPSNTMNPSITCTNNFSAGSINSITNYRDSRTCLTGTCTGGGQPPANDDCADAESIPCNSSQSVSNLNATPAGGNDPELPAGSPSCQWQGTPTNVHNTIWYSFFAEDTSIEIETCATTAVQDTILALYGGSCGSLTQLACSEDACGSSTYQSRICYNGLTPGNTYLVMVGNPGGWSGSAPGTIELDLACPCPDIGPVAGACCLPGGGCSDFETPTSCASQGGTFQGAGTSCGGVTCGAATEACCLGGGGCQDLDPSSCGTAGGTAQGPGTDCTDTDNDGTADLCGDACPNDPNKIAPGVCGCGVLDVDSDNDGTLDCNDGCPNDPNKIAPGICGCGVADTDTDNDGTPDCNDLCPNDPNKIAPGDCGCGFPDTDSDGDGTADCIDGCPNDVNKIAPGDCGCGLPDIDSDGDGTADCIDGCPNDVNKIAPGVCGCGVADTDSDNDGTPDCNDLCPNDPNKIAPGDCGCGFPETDANMNGTSDCLEAAACCIAGVCSLQTESDCTTAGGVWQGLDTDCVVDPCSADIDNLATADFATARGSISGGSYLDTHVQDDVREALSEEVVGGNPNRARSLLDHTWTFNVAAGGGYEFFVDAHHTPNGEGDDFVFSYSLDNASYSTMLTVTKTVDDGVLQSFAFAEDVAGTVYVRIVDGDGTRGNGGVDTLFVDEMLIRTYTGGDFTPPAAPTGLAAAPGNGTVSLDWADNTEGDLDGYNVYRSTTSGGPYSQLNGALLATSDYVDNAVVNNTTYYYVVTAVELAGNESANSGQASATPQGPGGGPGTHVSSIVVTTVNLGQGFKRGRAVVVVVDENSAPVANATVVGTFSGSLNESVSGVTNASGSVTLDTVSTKKGGVSIQFCVDDITHASLAYDPASNVETCDIN